MDAGQDRHREVKVQCILFTRRISYFISYVCHLLLFYLHFLGLFWTCVDGSTCIRPQRIPRRLKFWKYCAIQRTGYIDATERCSRAWWTLAWWSSCTAATVWQAILCALLSQPSPLWAAPLWQVVWDLFQAVEWDGNDGWWCKTARFIGCKTHCTFRIIFYDQLIWHCVSRS